MEENYNHQVADTTWQQFWKEHGVYKPAHSDGPLFSMDTPLPVVSGSPHIEDLLSYIEADIIARYKRILGHSVVHTFGFDNSNLVTQRYVEKNTKQSVKTIGRDIFTQLCLQETSTIQQEFKVLWERLGCSADWDYTYSTMAPSVRRLSQASFLDLLRKGYAYRAKAPGLYCTTCRTSVAQAEVEEVTISLMCNTIMFKDIHGNSLPVATTRPELLPACVALFFNPNNPRYQHLQGTPATVPLLNTTVPILANEDVLLDKGTGLVMCCTFGDIIDIAWYSAFNLPYKQVVGLDGKLLPSANIPGGAALEGLTIADARLVMVEELKKACLLLEQNIAWQVLDSHEQCKGVIEYIILTQWFIRVLDFKKEYLKLSKKILWHSISAQSRYTHWVENLSRNWCISRQRSHGIPFPVWHCNNPDCDAMLVAQEDKLPLDPQNDASPIHLDITTERGTCKKCFTEHNRVSYFVPDTDVMDTWHTLALTPYINAETYSGNKMEFSPTHSTINNVLYPKDNYETIGHTNVYFCGFKDNLYYISYYEATGKENPYNNKKRRVECGKGKPRGKKPKVDGLPLMSMRSQTHDTMRTWAFYSITLSWMHDKTIPWQDIEFRARASRDYNHQHALSQINTHPSLDYLFQHYSADVIRHSVVHNRLYDAVFSQELITELWDAFRFIKTHCYMFDCKESFDTMHNTQSWEALGLINQWILEEATKCYQNYADALDNGLDLHNALSDIDNFFLEKFCDTYLRCIKNQLLKPELYATQEIQTTQLTLYSVGIRILQFYAPYLPHITEALYQEIYKAAFLDISIHHLRHSKIQKIYDHDDNSYTMDKLLSIDSDVYRLRSSHHLSPETDIAELTLIVSDLPYFLKKYALHEALLKRMCRVSNIIYQQGNYIGSTLIPTNNAWSAQVYTY